MKRISLDPFVLIGIRLPLKTSNVGGRSAVDCGNLWSAFEKGGYFDKIPNRSSDDIYAVYFNYEGNHLDPFSYFIGCGVDVDEKAPADLGRLVIPGGVYGKFTAKGKIPDCISAAWRGIWENRDLPRAFRPDFEVYGKKSSDRDRAEVDIYVSVSEKAASR